MDENTVKLWKQRGVNLLIVGIVAGCAVATVATGYKSAVLTLRGERAVATCTRIETRRATSSKTGSSAVWHVSFTTPDGSTQQAAVDAFLSGLQPGETVNILYDPLKPTRAENDRFFSLWALPLFYGTLTALLVTGIVKFWRRPAA